ncbi:DUF4280 domain-containing protein [Flavobacterium sp. ZT3R18]|nr:DUF4280 domain-containing protein [Flavobacterium sp. ZT3R18]
MLQERLDKEQKEKDEIFDFSKNKDQINEDIAGHNIEHKSSQNTKRKEKAKEEKKKEEKASDGQKMVLDGAKLQCTLCTNPLGDLKVNFDTPTTQGKKTATVKEKDMKSLIFKGNCTKSPQSSSPCASMMQLGKWKDVGTSKVQEQFPLLLKSTIKCNYGGVDIKITDCGQRNEPEDVKPASKGLKKKKILSMAWMYDDMEEKIQKAYVREKISVLIKTRNYKEGEAITIIVDDKNGYDAKDGVKEITFSGTVGADGQAILKEEVELEDVAEGPKHKTDKELQREEAKKTEIYITREGKDYTRAEWKEYQEKWQDDMDKIKAEKKKGFWDSIKK